MAETENPPVLLHVLDLPQLYTRPSAAALLQALDDLALKPPSFSSAGDEARSRSRLMIDPDGVPRYLTSIIASSLSWIDDEDVKDEIRTCASTRLSERSGRTAMPTMTRTFNIPFSGGLPTSSTDITSNAPASNQSEVNITLHEPSLTGDSLGLKTWASSLLLSKRLHVLRRYLPSAPEDRLRVLELGSGTGLVGIAAACIWGAAVTLTDLPEIMSNLSQNVSENEQTASRFGGTLQTQPLDWSDAAAIPPTPKNRFPVLVAADPIYSAEHPQMLVQTVERWIQLDQNARFIIALPLRESYSAERAELRVRLAAARMQIEVEGQDVGFDDWIGSDGERKEVTCWWAVWRFSAERFVG